LGLHLCNRHTDSDLWLQARCYNW